MQTVHAMMRGLIDYAGLFPPAKLEMAPTVRNFASYRADARDEFVSRLVIPVSRLDEFEEHAADLLPRDIGAGGGDDDEDGEILVDPWRITALTRGADDAGLVADLDRIERFNEKYSDPDNGLAAIDAIELKATTAEEIDRAVGSIPSYLTAAFELPWTMPDLRGVITAVSGEGLCAKIRTGGMTPDLFPPPDALARFIRTCAMAQTPFKATAGLHHPIRHLNQGQGVTMHGFVNVAMAAAMALALRADEKTLIEVLDERETRAFGFSDEAIVWRGHRVTLEQIERTRESFFLSIGSCSVDEPLDDLKSLGLLDVTV